MSKPLATALFAAALFAGFPTLVLAQAANQMQPGLWRFTQRTGAAGGAARQRTQNRCVSAAEAGNPAMYFAPRASGATCAVTNHSALGTRLATRVRCTAGADVTDADISITLDTPQHLTIATTMTRGAQTAQMQGEGQFVGPCGARARKKR